MELGEQALRHAARSMQHLADQVRAVGARALAEAEVGWRSRGAENFREQLGTSGAAIHDCAARLEQAAARLAWHADRCQAASWVFPPW